MAKACKTALHRLEVEDGFRVLRTPNSAHTFRLYKRITDALQVSLAAHHCVLTSPRPQGRLGQAGFCSWKGGRRELQVWCR